MLLQSIELTFDEQFSMSVLQADEAGQDENRHPYKEGDWLTSDQSGVFGGVTLFLVHKGASNIEVLEALKNELLQAAFFDGQ